MPETTSLGNTKPISPLFRNNNALNHSALYYNQTYLVFLDSLGVGLPCLQITTNNFQVDENDP